MVRIITNVRDVQTEQEKLEVLEKKLKPLVHGKFYSKIGRKMAAGWDKFVRLVLKIEWSTQQEHVAKKLNAQISVLKRYYDSINVGALKEEKEINEFKNINDAINTQLKTIKTVLGHLKGKDNKKIDKKISQKEINDLEKELATVAELSNDKKIVFANIQKKVPQQPKDQVENPKKEIPKKDEAVIEHEVPKTPDKEALIDDKKKLPKAPDAKEVVIKDEEKELPKVPDIKEAIIEEEGGKLPKAPDEKEVVIKDHENKAKEDLEKNKKRIKIKKVRFDKTRQGVKGSKKPTKSEKIDKQPVLEDKEKGNNEEIEKRKLEGYDSIDTEGKLTRPKKEGKHITKGLNKPKIQKQEVVEPIKKEPEKKIVKQPLKNEDLKEFKKLKNDVIGLLNTIDKDLDKLVTHDKKMEVEFPRQEFKELLVNVKGQKGKSLKLVLAEAKIHLNVIYEKLKMPLPDEISEIDNKVLEFNKRIITRKEKEITYNLIKNNILKTLKEIENQIDKLKIPQEIEKELRPQINKFKSLLDEDKEIGLLAEQAKLHVKEIYKQLKIAIPQELFIKIDEDLKTLKLSSEFDSIFEKVEKASKQAKEQMEFLQQKPKESKTKPEKYDAKKIGEDFNLEKPEINPL